LILFWQFGIIIALAKETTHIAWGLMIDISFVLNVMGLDLEFPSDDSSANMLQCRDIKGQASQPGIWFRPGRSIYSGPGPSGISGCSYFCHTWRKCRASFFIQLKLAPMPPAGLRAVGGGDRGSVLIERE
jgi:hypothetical protein